jgi:hypothetical protein
MAATHTGQVSAGELLVPVDIIPSVASTLAQIWYMRHKYA